MITQRSNQKLKNQIAAFDNLDTSSYLQEGMIFKSVSDGAYVVLAQISAKNFKLFKYDIASGMIKVLLIT